MMKYKDVGFKSGDIGLSSCNTWLSKAIRGFTSMHTGEARFSHAYAYLGWDLVVEALAKVSVNRAEKYKNSTIAVYRLPLSDEDRANFKYGMLRRTNKAYGWLKIPLFALDAISTKVTSWLGKKKPVFFFTKYVGISNIPVCSQLVVWGLHNLTSYRLKDMFGEEAEWKVMSPDYLDDLLKLDINQAELIYENIKEDD